MRRKLALVAFAMVLAGCSGDNQTTDVIEEDFPSTGHPVFETEMSPDFTIQTVSDDGLNESATEEVGQKPIESVEQKKLDTTKNYYIYATRLNVRSGPGASYPVVSVLNINDEVALIDGNVESDYVEISVIKSHSQFPENTKLYVSYKYLSQKKNEAKKLRKKFKYFMVQNLASERIRVYEKMCDDGNCHHKMVMEAEAAVGEPDDAESIGGYFHISSWHKFYQDNAGSYPSWYHPNYNMPPGPDSSPRTWAKDKYLPYNGAKVRGAFGWYTAKLAPNARYQWTHGTIGWGSDKKEFIKATRGFFANIFLDPRSSGCTRTDNESIAYIRQLLEVGTPILKIYAKEAYADPRLNDYPNTTNRWDYILTKNGAQKDGQKSDRYEVLDAGTPVSKWLEEGTYTIDQRPDARAFLEGSHEAIFGKNANIYGFKNKHMRGVFLVDAGVLVGYQHPSKLKVGGYTNERIPSYVKAPISKGFAMPECPLEKDNGPDDFHRSRKKDRRCSEKAPRLVN